MALSSAYLKLLGPSHPGSKCDSYQQSFGSDQMPDRLAPRFLFVLYEHSMPLRFQLPRCLFNVIHVKLEPGLRRRNVVRPGILAKTRL